MDAPQRANSGHPGTAMALAPLAHVLYSRVMRHDPSHPDWPDRDRFILSNGHASILLYSMLFLNGYGLEPRGSAPVPPVGIADARPPRGPCPARGRGHDRPARARGSPTASAWRSPSASCGRISGPELIDHHIFATCGDGDLMEGVSHEAASLAGHLGLGRLVYVYDDNHITIDGPTELAYTDDVVKRFEGLRLARRAPRRGGQRPRRPRGGPAPRHGRGRPPVAARAAQPHRLALAASHRHQGGPRGPPRRSTRSALTKALLGLPAGQGLLRARGGAGLLPRGAPTGAGRPARPGSAARRSRSRTGTVSRRAWPGGACRAGPTRCRASRPARSWPRARPSTSASPRPPAPDPGPHRRRRRPDRQHRRRPRQRRRDPVARASRRRPAPLRHPRARHGRRDDGHGPARRRAARRRDLLRLQRLRPPGAIRLAALSQAHVVYFFTHDSVGLGEDGPTHQPIEQLASLRAMPGLRLIRPADANETAAGLAHRRRLRRADGARAQPPGAPGARPRRPRSRPRASPAAPMCSCRARRDAPDIVLIGTGSEVQHCLGAARAPASRGSRGPRRLVPELGPVRRARRRATATRCCRPGSRVSRSRPAPRSAGSATRTRRSRSTASVLRRRGR